VRVLSLESSTDSASVALWVDGRVLAEESFESKRSLSADLFPVLWRLLEPFERMERIVVGLGPGSYAGVRIAIAAALGLQVVWDCELVGIPSVAGLADAAENCRVIGDARRGTWYYTRVERGVCLAGPQLVDSAEALRALLEKDGGEICATEELAPEWGACLRRPSAALLARLAAADVGIVQRGELEPLYLREAHITKPKEAKG
jgi:tRNA threonylcarbamoyladenosine biosynthesis protein TsaB